MRPTVRRWTFLGLVIAALLGLAVHFAVDTGRIIATLRHEHAGKVTVTGCTFISFGQHRNSYSCRGTFLSNDGDLRVPAVTFTHNGRMSPGDVVDASLSGPADRTATVSGWGSVVWGLTLTLGCAIGLVLIVVDLFRRRARGSRPP